MEEDKKTYEEFLNGNEDALNKLIEKYKTNLIYFITRYVKNTEIAEDIFQEVILYILENKEKYDSNYSLKTYLYTIAKSKAINYIKKESKITELDDNISNENLLEEIIMSKERKEKISKVIEKLSSDYQLVIYLTKFEGLSYKETANIMDKTEAQIKTLAHNSKKKLRKLLIKEKVVEIKNNKILKLISILIVLGTITLGATSIGFAFSDEIANFIKKLFGPNSTDGVEKAVQSGYVSEINSEFKDTDGIEISVDTILMDDANFGINFDIILDKKYDVNEFHGMKIEDLRIIDEQNNIVFSTDYHMKNNPSGEPEYWGGYSFSTEIIDESNLRISLSATGNPEPFPKSKKLNVSFTKIKTLDEKIFEGKWNFEVDVPEEFYSRESVIYKVKSCNDTKTVVEDAVLTNTSFKISIPVTTTDKINYKALFDRINFKNVSDMIALQKEYVETSDGKIFKPAARDGNMGYSSSSDENKITNYHQTFDLTKYDATDILAVHIFTNTGEEIIIEFERK